jgi:GH24 family phage-related lysozyme (muramidase)
MKIDLHNFFKFYDEKNPKHVAAVEQLEFDMDSKLLDDSSNWVRIFRTRLEAPKPSSNILNLPWFPQTDNYTLADSTCNSSSCAMALEFLKPGTLKGSKGDDEYLHKVLALGQSTDHNIQTKVLESYKVFSIWKQTLTFADLDRELSLGKPVVIGILHRGTLSVPTGGHIIVVIGKTADGKSYVVNDPYGSLLNGYSGPVIEGKGAIYPKSILEKRWTVDGPNTGWGRVFVNTSTLPQTNSKTKEKIPQQSLDLIKEFEGFSSKAYYDPLTKALPITIGYGSTRRRDGTRFAIGNTVTQSEAEDLLAYQLETDYIPTLSKIPYWNEMNDEMKGSLLSFGYNLGSNFYGSSDFGTITRHLKDKMWKNIPDALMLYVNPGTNVTEGLKRRRRSEGSLWNSGLSKIS